MTLRSLLALLLLAVTLRSGESVKCYVCHSMFNLGCARDPKAHGMELLECNTETFLKFSKSLQHKTTFNFPMASIPPTDYTCMKLDMQIGEEVTVVRGCSVNDKVIPKPCRFYESLSSALGTNTVCNLCDTDGCNGSNIAAPNVFYTFLFVVGSFILNVYNRNF